MVIPSGGRKGLEELSGEVVLCKKKKQKTKTGKERIQWPRACVRAHACQSRLSASPVFIVEGIKK